jgi:hypothetical protein
MNDWAFALQLGVVLVVILAIAASTIGVAFRSSRAGVEPSVKASFKKLQAGWFQLMSPSPTRRLTHSSSTNSDALSRERHG